MNGTSADAAWLHKRMNRVSQAMSFEEEPATQQQQRQQQPSDLEQQLQQLQQQQQQQESSSFLAPFHRMAQPDDNRARREQLKVALIAQHLRQQTQQAQQEEQLLAQVLAALTQQQQEQRQLQQEQQRQQQQQRTVIDLFPLLKDMSSPLRGVYMPPIFHSSLESVHPMYKTVLSNTAVFQFASRPARLEDPNFSQSFSRTASSFLQKLHGSNPSLLVEDLYSLVCLQCSKCSGNFHTTHGHDEYESSNSSHLSNNSSCSSTQFVGIHQADAVDCLTLSLDRLRAHMLECSFVTGTDKFLISREPLLPMQAKTELFQFLLFWHAMMTTNAYPKTAATTTVGGGGVPARTLKEPPQQQVPRNRSLSLPPQQQVIDIDEQDEEESQSRSITTITEFEQETHRDLETCFAKARKFYSKSEVVVAQDLTCLPSCPLVMESTLLELILQSLEMVVVQTKHKQKQHKHNGETKTTMQPQATATTTTVCIRCRYCHGDNDKLTGGVEERGCLTLQSIPKTSSSSSSTFSKTKLDDTESIRILGMHHYSHCRKMPPRVQEQFPAVAGRQLINNNNMWYNDMGLLLDVWNAHLETHVLLRSSSSATAASKITPKHDTAADLYLPLSSKTRYAATTGPDGGQIPLFRAVVENYSCHDYYLTTQTHHHHHRNNVVDTTGFNEHDVLLDNEFAREFEGNRGFRRLVGQHRGFYLSSASSSSSCSEQQELIVETLLSVISRRGGSFYSFDKKESSGWKRLSHGQRKDRVRKALDCGFPEMLRPPMDKTLQGPGCRVYDLEQAPWIGVLHGEIRWPSFKNASRHSLESGDTRKVAYTSADRGALNSRNARVEDEPPTKRICLDRDDQVHQRKVIAPPGKLGITMGYRGVHFFVLAVPASSVMYRTIFTGERIVAVDNDDTRQMSLDDFTAMMKRTSSFERTLTVLSAPENFSSYAGAGGDGANVSSNGGWNRNVAAPANGISQCPVTKAHTADDDKGGYGGKGASTQVIIDTVFTDAAASAESPRREDSKKNGNRDVEKHKLGIGAVGGDIVSTTTSSTNGISDVASNVVRITSTMGYGSNGSSSAINNLQGEPKKPEVVICLLDDDSD
jgi:hypothetical protein